MSDGDVQLVLGLPSTEDGLGGSKLFSAQAHQAVKAILGLGKNSKITLDYVESLLTREYCGKMSTNERNAFKVAVVIFADAYLAISTKEFPSQSKLQNHAPPGGY